MTRSTAAAFALLGLVAFSACGVDGRTLSYDFHALEPAGGGGGRLAIGASGADNAGASGFGPGGESGAGEGEAPDPSGGSAHTVTGGASSGGTSSDHAGMSAGGTSASAGMAGADAPMEGDTGGTGGGETLVRNAGFDTAATGWDADPFVTATWDSRDGSAQPGSGSILLHDTSPVATAAGTYVSGVHQCMPATPNTSYDLSTRVNVLAGQTGDAAGINVWMFDDDSCQGNRIGADDPLWGGVADTWTTLSGMLWVPSDVHSLSVRLVAIKPFTQADLQVLMDDVVVVKH